MRLIVYHENGQPLGVVMLPAEVRGNLRRVAEIATRQDDDIQFIIQCDFRDRNHICRIAIDRATQSVSGDVDSCPHYNSQVMARYDDDEHRATHVSLLADVDDNGLVVVVMATRNPVHVNQMAILRPSDLRRIGELITLPFNNSFAHEQLDSSRGRFMFSIRDDNQKGDLYCCIVHPAKL